MELKERLAKLSEANKGRFEQLEIDKNRWINEVKNLYRDIEDWFSEYISQEFLIIDYHTLKDAECEEFIMETSIMELKLGGGPSVFLEPTGINIVGAFGKIDLYFQGHKNEKIFVLLIEKHNNELHWEIWKRKRQQETILFNKETFEELLNEWLEKWTEIDKDM